MKTFVFVDFDALRSANDSSGALESQFKQLLDRFEKNSVIVPVTRQCVFDDIEEVKNAEFVITNFGGVLLKNGAEDTFWRESIYAELSEFQISLTEIEERLLQMNRLRNFDQDIRVVRDEHQSYYICVDGSEAPKKFQQFRAALRNSDVLPFKFHEKYYMSHLPSKLAIVPCALRPGHAVQYLMSHEAKTQPAVSIGFGNALSDLSFMSVCDFWLTSSKSQLATTVYSNVNF